MALGAKGNDDGIMAKGYAFGESALQSVVIPSSLRTIEEGAFSQCRKLKRVIFSENCSLARIEDGCFSETNIRNIEVPRSILTLWSRAFLKCQRLKKVTFQKGCRLERIDEGCSQESGLEELQTPQSLREIGSGAFYGCVRLKKVWLNEGLEASADTFRGCTSLETVQVGADCAVDVRKLVNDPTKVRRE